MLAACGNAPAPRAQSSSIPGATSASTPTSFATASAAPIPVPSQQASPSSHPATPSPGLHPGPASVSCSALPTAALEPLVLVPTSGNGDALLASLTDSANPQTLCTINNAIYPRFISRTEINYLTYVFDPNFTHQIVRMSLTDMKAVVVVALPDSKVQDFGCVRSRSRAREYHAAPRRRTTRSTGASATMCSTHLPGRSQLRCSSWHVDSARDAASPSRFCRDDSFIGLPSASSPPRGERQQPLLG